MRDKLLIEKHIAIKSGKQDEDTKDGIFCKIFYKVHESHEQRSEAKGDEILTDGMLLFRYCLSSVLTATLSPLMLNCWQY